MINKLLYIFIISTLITASANCSEISLENEISFDSYGLYKYNYSLKVAGISSGFGDFAVEGFYDDYGLRETFNGINTFAGNFLGIRLFFDNNWKNFYYHIGIGNENFQNFKDNIFYELALAYWIPIVNNYNLIFNLKINRFQSQINPLSSYLGISNQMIQPYIQLKSPIAYVEASYLINSLTESDIPKELLINEGLIEKVPKNKLTSFYIYAYREIFKGVNTGLVYSAANSNINVFQPTYMTESENFYTYFPYFTPVDSKALSLLLSVEHNIKLGSIDFGRFSFKVQFPVISSAKLLYEVKEGEITPEDSVYYDYSGVEPLTIELFWNKKIGDTGFSFTVGYTYFDKPYIKNAYFSNKLNGYKNHQLIFKLMKLL